MKSNTVVKLIPQHCHTAVWSTEVMAVTGENQVNARMTCSGATLNATDLREQTGDRITFRRRRRTDVWNASYYLAESIRYKNEPVNFA
jgi:hypothetical protein